MRKLCLFTPLVITMSLVANICALASSDQEHGFAREGFRRLPGDEVRTAFSGRTFSDGTHFSYEYRRDGSVVGMANGTRHKNSWSVEEDRLCLEESDGRTCFYVWRKREEMRLVAEGWTDIYLSGVLR